MYDILPPKDSCNGPLSSGPLQLSLSCIINEILSLISQNVKRSRDSEHIPLGGNISYMQLYVAHRMAPLPMPLMSLKVTSAV